MKKTIIIICATILIYIFFIYSFISNAATSTDTGLLSIDVTPGVDSIYAPIFIDHGLFNVENSNQISEILWDETGPNLEYIEFDLGSGSVDFDITASIDNNFIGQDPNNTFNANNVEMKSCKESGYCSTDNWPERQLGIEQPDNCVVFTPSTDMNYTQIGSTGITLVDDGISGLGSNCTLLSARWRFVPATKIFIPQGAKTDFYTTNLTFTLTTR